MGKTASGAVWLDPEKTSPYEYFQFWVNTDDNDVAKFMSLFTFLPMEEINELQHFHGADLNSAKAILAFEAVSLAHGKAEAEKAYKSAVSMFGSRTIPESLLPSSEIPRKVDDCDSDNMPTTEINRQEIGEGMPAFKFFHKIGLANSGGAARKLIQQGGAYINGERINVDHVVSEDDFKESEAILRAGKKRYHKVRILQQ
jgi:tyrosyl-tRNA synthetase